MKNLKESKLENVPSSYMSRWESLFNKTIDITSVVKVPDTIPEGKEVLPE
tara:strand:+ start:126 stop:275 length:150 start_codon:yes stop_codon:yes gene_type:complete